VPGELEHASGEVDEFEAALVSGAEGHVVEDEDELDTRDEVDATEAEAAAEPDAEAPDDEPAARSPRDEDDLDEDDEVDDATLEREAAAAGPRRAAGPPGTPTRKGAGRFAGFLRASWAELQRVQWPDRRQVAQATGVVLGFVIIAGLYLGVADWVAKQIVNAII
jgi:preprotein translocase subunit SecE